MDFSILHKSSESLCSSAINLGNYIIYFNENEFEIIIIDHWTFLWCGEYRTIPNLNRIINLLSSSNYDEVRCLRGILIAIDSLNFNILIFNDSYGSFPVYYSVKYDSKNFGISSHIKKLVKSCYSIDYTSVFEFIKNAYVIGNNTLYKEIKRLNANSLLKVSLTGEVMMSCLPLKNFWVENSSYTSNKIDEIIDILREESKNFDECQVMLSAGWDSRTILAATYDRHPVAYSHGDSASREIKIVRKICEACNIELFVKDILDIDISIDLVLHYLLENESAMMPHWFFGGQLAKINNRILTSGTFGEVLGGHYGILNAMNGKDKYFLLLKDILCYNKEKKITTSQSLEFVHNLLKSKLHTASWIFKDDYKSIIYALDTVEDSNTRIYNELSRYVDEGTCSTQSIFERFYTEHRGARYINLQPMNSISSTKIRNIYTNSDLVELSAKIPLKFRIHNKINQKCIRVLAPKLLDFPMAATLVNARSPLLIQEFSRLARKVLEMYSPIVGGLKNLGWNNFESFRNDKYLSSMAGLLTDSIWDIEAIKEMPQINKSTSMFSYFDMISKAITIEWIINGNEGRL